jgi:predicted Zn-dependent protease
MSGEKYIDIINNPFSLDGYSLNFLKKVTTEFPYCQTAQILMAKNIESFDKMAYEKHVNLASAYTIEMKKLRKYLSEKEYTVLQNNAQVIEKPDNSAPASDFKKMSKEELLAIVNNRLSQISAEKGQANNSVEVTEKSKPTPSVKMFVVEELLEKPPINQEPVAKNPVANRLIDKFLTEEPTIKLKKDMPEVEADHSRESNNENHDIISETLAQIYYNQGQKERAISVYKKLSLKFPEKSSYFAQKIADIQKETN